MAVLVSAALGLGLIVFVGQDVGLQGIHLWILGATGVLAGVSFCDDRWGLPPLLRFSLQMITAVALVVGGGLALDSISLPFGGILPLGPAGPPVTVLFLVWMANLYNFMDGMDGFAGGMTMLGFAFLAYFGWHSGQQFIFLTALLLSVGAAGFLLHNFPPARIFMGDVGSVPIGFLAGALALLGCRERRFDVWVPLILFSPFVVDATMTLMRRVARQEKVWEAHRTHYYQRLVLAGWGHRRTVLAEYGLMMVCGALAVMYDRGHEWQRVVVLMGGALLYLVLIIGVQAVERKVVG